MHVYVNVYGSGTSGFRFSYAAGGKSDAYRWSGLDFNQKTPYSSKTADSAISGRHRGRPYVFLRIGIGIAIGIFAVIETNSISIPIAIGKVGPGSVPASPDGRSFHLSRNDSAVAPA